MTTMPPATPLDTIIRVAADIRLQLAPGLGVLDRLSFDRLRAGVVLHGLGPPLFTRVRAHGGLSDATYAVSEFDLAMGEAWVWMNRTAYAEFCDGKTPRSRATVAHEAGHLGLSVLEMDELGDLDAEHDHDHRLDRDAWTFAAHCLIPDQGLHRLKRLRSDEIAARYGVSLVMAGNRIREFEKAFGNGSLQ